MVRWEREWLLVCFRGPSRRTVTALFGGKPGTSSGDAPNSARYLPRAPWGWLVAARIREAHDGLPCGVGLPSKPVVDFGLPASGRLGMAPLPDHAGQVDASNHVGRRQGVVVEIRHRELSRFHRSGPAAYNPNGHSPAGAQREPRGGCLAGRGS